MQTTDRRYFQRYENMHCDGFDYDSDDDGDNGYANYNARVGRQEICT